MSALPEEDLWSQIDRLAVDDFVTIAYRRRGTTAKWKEVTGTVTQAANPRGDGQGRYAVVLMQSGPDAGRQVFIPQDIRLGAKHPMEYRHLTVEEPDELMTSPGPTPVPLARTPTLPRVPPPQFPPPSRANPVIAPGAMPGLTHTHIDSNTERLLQSMLGNDSPLEEAAPLLEIDEGFITDPEQWYRLRNPWDLHQAQALLMTFFDLNSLSKVAADRHYYKDMLKIPVYGMETARVIPAVCQCQSWVRSMKTAIGRLFLARERADGATPAQIAAFSKGLEEAHLSSWLTEARGAGAQIMRLQQSGK
jgi:hypothetical protein